LYSKNNPVEVSDNKITTNKINTRILTIGETTYDILFRNGKPVGACGGGSAFNSSISLGRCGLPVSLISTFGNDRIGDLALKMLEDNSVNCRLIKRFEGQSRVALAFFNDNNNPEYSFYAASVEVIPDYPEPLKDDLILLGSSFALRDKGRTELLNFLRKAHEVGCCVIYDPNARRHLADDPHFMAKILENISLATIVKGSDEDFRFIFNESGGEGAYKQIRKAGADSLAYTKGPEGAELFTPEFHFAVKAREINVISTIGAGDNFSAGLIYGLYLNKLKDLSFNDLMIEDWKKIMDSGTLFAGEVCQSPENYISWDTARVLKLMDN
jgi:fructokinase